MNLQLLTVHVLASVPLAVLAIAPAPPLGGEACRRAAESAAAHRIEDPAAMQRFVFHAVLEGLYADGVDDATVDRILAPDERGNALANFVTGCPICIPAQDALRVYRARAPLTPHKGEPDRNTFGPGLDAATRARIADPRLAERQAAIQRLVEIWVARRIDLWRFTEAERRLLDQQLEIGRKQGMASLDALREQGFAASYEQMKGCAFCDGACAPQ